MHKFTQRVDRFAEDIGHYLSLLIVYVLLFTSFAVIIGPLHYLELNITDYLIYLLIGIFGLVVNYYFFKQLKIRRSIELNRRKIENELDEIKQKEQAMVKTTEPPKTSLLLMIFYLIVIFLLLAGWIALLLAPPFGTALAILLAFVFGSFLR